MVIENWFSEVMPESKTPWPNDEGPWSVPSVADVLCARRLGASAWAWPRRIVGFGAPAGGWYLPDVAARHAELDSFDIVEGLVIKGGTAVEVLNGVSLHGGLTLSCPRPTLTAKIAVEMIVAHWRECGLPHYAQFDNDTGFQGAPQFPDNMGRGTRLCLSLPVTPGVA